MSITDLWPFRPLPPDWALNAWLGFAGKWNICGAGGIGIRSLGPGSPGDGYPQRGSEDDQCRPWLNGAPVPWDDFWARCLASQEPPEGREWVDDWNPTKPGQLMSPPMSARDSVEGVQRIVSESLAYQRWHRPIAKPAPDPGHYLVTFRGERPRFAEWDGTRLLVYSADHPAHSVDTALVARWVRLVPEQSDPAPVPKAPPAPPVGVWLGRSANEDETLAHARLHGCDEGYGWWARVLENGALSIGGWNGSRGMPGTLDAAPALNAEHAAELAEVRRKAAKPEGPAVGVWLGRAPTVEERRAHARTEFGATDHIGLRYGWWVAVSVHGEARAVDYRGDRPLPRIADAAPARDEAHARELCEARRQREASAGPRIMLVPEASGADPRIGRWIRDMDGDVFLLLSHVSDAPGVYGSALAVDGDSACVELTGAEIIDPPDPIPAPCRPVWEAFEALRKSRQV